MTATAKDEGESPMRFAIFLALLLPWCVRGADPSYTGIDMTANTAVSVTIPSSAQLHTAQLLPWTAEGKIAAKEKQVAQLWENLDRVLVAAKTSRNKIVKLNVYAVDDAALQSWRKSLATAKDVRTPAVSVVVGRLSHPDAVIAMDAIVLADSVVTVQEIIVRGLPTAGSAGRILPAGTRVYVAGQAEKADTPQEATRKTLESLRNTLKWLNLTDAHVVQCKGFLTPMTSATEVTKTFVEFFGEGKTPPIVLVEWKSTLPIEIELIAASPTPKRKQWDEVEYLTPPGMTASPVYSRVTRTNAAATTYIGSLTSSEAGDGKREVQSIFDQLGKVLMASGSDFRHLVKATYYVAKDDPSAQLNQLRPNYYDPRRPPSASKAMVPGVGQADRFINVDMIAVPSTLVREGKPEVGHGLTPELAAEGWISLFDGKTTFGWEGAEVEKGLLLGGKTLTRFGPCEYKVAFADFGSFTVSGATNKIPVASTLGFRDLKGTSTIELGATTKVKSILAKPLKLKSIMPEGELKGWKRMDRPNTPEDRRPKWAMNRGVLEVVGGPGALESAEEYSNVVIQLEARSRNRHANGGLFFRCISGDFMNGYEVQIHSACEKGDPAQPAEYATGGIDDRQNARRLVSRDFQPFTMTVVADGPTIAVWVNGHQTASWKDTRPKDDNPRKGLRLTPGPIQLQAHDPATDLEFRKLGVQELR